MLATYHNINIFSFRQYQNVPNLEAQIEAEKSSILV